MAAPSGGDGCSEFRQGGAEGEKRQANDPFPNTPGPGDRNASIDQ